MGGSLHALPHGWRLRERRRYGALEWPSSTAAPPRHEEDVLRNEDGRFVAMFAYTDAVAERYPTIRAGVMHATGLVNRPSSSELLDDYRAEQQAASERLKAMAIADLPSIAAWRRAFARFGAKPTQHRNAAEALLRRLAKHGDIPTVNTLVDIGNLVSIRHALPVAVFDLANIDGCITVRFATSLTSAPQPDQVVRVVTDQPLHWSERRPREPKSVSNQAHQHRSRRPSSLTHRTEVTSLGWPLRSGNPERPVPHGGHPSRQGSPAPTGYPPTAGFRPDRPAGGRP